MSDDHDLTMDELQSDVLKRDWRRAAKWLNDPTTLRRMTASERVMILAALNAEIVWLHGLMTQVITGGDQTVRMF